MLTMATFWNAMSAETRVTAAKRLLVVLKMGDAALAALEGKMKGGDWGTYKLDTSNYLNHGVKLPRGWVEAFEEKAVAQLEQMSAPTVWQFCGTAHECGRATNLSNQWCGNLLELWSAPQHIRRRHGDVQPTRSHRLRRAAVG